MALKKTIAGYHKISEENVKEWIDEMHIDMHPLEEEMTLAFWKMNDLARALPAEPSINEEHEWMIEFGADYVKSKRQEYKDACALIMPGIEKLKELYLSAQQEWSAHVEKCVELGLNPDFSDEVNLTELFSSIGLSAPTRENI